MKITCNKIIPISTHVSVVRQTITTATKLKINVKRKSKKPIIIQVLHFYKLIIDCFASLKSENARQTPLSFILCV